MAEPIANDWKAIHDRLRQIQAEHFAAARPCPQCNGSGWMSEHRVAQRSYDAQTRRASVFWEGVCNLCHNPGRLPRPN